MKKYDPEQAYMVARHIVMSEPEYPASIFSDCGVWEGIKLLVWMVLNPEESARCAVRETKKAIAERLRHQFLSSENINEIREALSEAWDLTESVPVSTHNGCYCKPGRCMAPKIMGRQMPCLDPDKAKAKNEQSS